MDISNGFKNAISVFDNIDLKSIHGKPEITDLLPLVGYALMIASLGDFVYLLLPLKFQDPSWTLQTLGLLVEQCWGFLIALALIFSRYFENNRYVREIELLVLKFIRWLVLLIALLFILSTPLIVLDTVRLHGSIHQQIGATDAAKLAQIREIESQLGQVSDPKTVMAIAQFVGLNPTSIEKAPLAQLKSVVKEKLTNLKINIETKVKLSRQEQSQKLLKSSFRSLYCILIISFTFIFISFKIGQFFRQI